MQENFSQNSSSTQILKTQEFAGVDQHTPFNVRNLQTK